MIRDLHADVEIDTPSIAVRPRGAGAYRISVYGDGTTAVTVREGQTEIYSPRGSQVLQARQTMLVRGSSANPEFQTEAEIAPDQFDDWSNNRDRMMPPIAGAPAGGYQQQPGYQQPGYQQPGYQQPGYQQPGYQNVPPEVAGAGELTPTEAGFLRRMEQCGLREWLPDASASTGDGLGKTTHGWTWVDYDPWGWAPFHYGRWFLNGGRGWCWWPGAIGRPSFWRPALVGFFGFGAGGVGFGIGFGFGNVGWVALAPFEAFDAWYGRGFNGGYNRNNVFIHNANIYNSFRNARVANAVAYAGVNNFGHGSQAFYRANGNQVREASLVRGQLPVTPGRGSLCFLRSKAKRNVATLRRSRERAIFQPSTTNFAAA